uniref:Uncharacterized protein n=1 Tax=Sphaerodactylus townsendi TaxID=933632 RepID=A0ACB8F3G3_9SAUR
MAVWYTAGYHCHTPLSYPPPGVFPLLHNITDICLLSLVFPTSVFWLLTQNASSLAVLPTLFLVTKMQLSFITVSARSLKALPGKKLTLQMFSLSTLLSLSTTMSQSNFG